MSRTKFRAAMVAAWLFPLSRQLQDAPQLPPPWRHPNCTTWIRRSARCEARKFLPCHPQQCVTISERCARDQIGPQLSPVFLIIQFRVEVPSKSHHLRNTAWLYFGDRWRVITFVFGFLSSPGKVTPRRHEHSRVGQWPGSRDGFPATSVVTNQPSASEP